MMNEVLFDLMLGVVIVVVVLITKHLVPYLKSQVQETEYSELLDLIEKAVHAVEQTIRESGQGRAKKAEVIKFIHKYLNENNIEISDEQLDKLVEAAVFAMNKSKKEG